MGLRRRLAVRRGRGLGGKRLSSMSFFALKARDEGLGDQANGICKYLLQVFMLAISAGWKTCESLDFCSKRKRQGDDTLITRNIFSLWGLASSMQATSDILSVREKIALLEREEKTASRFLNAIIFLIAILPFFNFFFAPIVDDIEAIKRISSRLRSSGYVHIANGNFFLLCFQFVIIFIATFWLEYRWRDARIRFMSKRNPDDGTRANKVGCALGFFFLSPIFLFAFGLFARTDGDSRTFNGFSYFRDTGFLLSAMFIGLIYNVYRYSRMIEAKADATSDD